MREGLLSLFIAWPGRGRPSVQTWPYERTKEGTNAYYERAGAGGRTANGRKAP